MANSMKSFPVSQAKQFGAMQFCKFKDNVMEWREGRNGARGSNQLNARDYHVMSEKQPNLDIIVRIPKEKDIKDISFGTGIELVNPAYIGIPGGNEALLVVVCDDMVEKH